MTPYAIRPHAQRPHNRTANKELLKHSIVDAYDGEAPHVFVTTSTGQVEVYPLGPEDVARLAKQFIAMVAHRIADREVGELAQKAVELAVIRLKKAGEDR